MRNKPLSPKMQAALDLAGTSRHEALFRWPGGYWAPDPWPGKDGPEVPHEYVGTETVYALVQRGKVAVVERMKRGDACRVNLV